MLSEIRCSSAGGAACHNSFAGISTLFQKITKVIFIVFFSGGHCREIVRVRFSRLSLTAVFEIHLVSELVNEEAANGFDAGLLIDVIRRFGVRIKEMRPHDEEWCFLVVDGLRSPRGVYFNLP